MCTPYYVWTRFVYSFLVFIVVFQTPTKFVPLIELRFSGTSLNMPYFPRDRDPRTTTHLLWILHYSYIDITLFSISVAVCLLWCFLVKITIRPKTVRHICYGKIIRIRVKLLISLWTQVYAQAKIKHFIMIRNGNKLVRIDLFTFAMI